LHDVIDEHRSQFRVVSTTVAVLLPKVLGEKEVVLDREGSELWSLITDYASEWCNKSALRELPPLS
jgi:hypothetical protein